MAKEKYYKRRHKKTVIAVLCILLVLTLAAGSTLAYMYHQTNQLDNKFEMMKVTCQVNANSSDSSFDVTNTGNIDAYIRAAIVVNWMDDADPDNNARGIAPDDKSEYDIVINTEDWILDPETKYYYYKHPVSPKAITENLINNYYLKDGVIPPKGYELCVEVVAEAIQAKGTTDEGNVPAVTDAWGISVDSDRNLYLKSE